MAYSSAQGRGGGKPDPTVSRHDGREGEAGKIRFANPKACGAP